MLGRILDAVADLVGRLSPADFTIRYRPGRPVAVRGKVSKAKAGAIAEFFVHDLAPGRPATVRGSRGRGMMTLRFSRSMTPAQRQRVRNFLVDLLR